MNKKSIAVIGGGIIGSWTALHLAEAGVKTTLIEQFPLPHSRGSSHGLSRAFRFLGELELDRLDYSFDRWRTLEKDCGQTLFVKTGLLNFGLPGDPDLERYMAVLRDGQRSHEWLDSTQIAERFPMLDYPEDWGAAWDPDGGLLVAQTCLTAVQAQFLDLGGCITTARVESLDADCAEGVRIDYCPVGGKDRETAFYDRAVVCAGPWTGKLLPELDALLQCLLIPVTYWHDASDACSAANGCPIIFNARMTGIYGIPSWEYPGLVKILFHGGPKTDPDTRDLAVADDIVAKVGDYVGRYLPSLNKTKPALVETCMYTMTGDSFPLIDRLSDKVVAGCGFSGSGFKHAPATGRMLAAFALDRDDTVPAGFRADRYRLARLRQGSAG